MAVITLDLIEGYGTRVSYTIPYRTNHDIPSRFFATEVLHSGHSTVYRGNFAHSGGQESVVICKVAKGDLSRIRREVGFYREQLWPLQGYHIPRFYAFYTTTTQEEGKDIPMGCMFLEDCGRPLPTVKELRKNQIVMYVADTFCDRPQH